MTMTNEQVINRLKQLIASHDCEAVYIDDNDVKALELAIRSLEHDTDIYEQGYVQGWKERFGEPKNLITLDDLRLMKTEECAGHTIEYAMGWKACIDWIKNGGDTQYFDKEAEHDPD